MAKILSKSAIKEQEKLKLARIRVDEGVKPFVAGLSVGMNAKDALKFEETPEMRAIMFNKIDTMSNRGVAERRGVTLGKLYDRLLDCAGIGYDREGNPRKGATRVISAVNTGKEASGGTTDFIEVPDWHCIVKAVKELAIIAGFITSRTGEEGGTVNVEKLIIIRPSNGKQQEQIIEMNVSA